MTTETPVSSGIRAGRTASGRLAVELAVCLLLSTHPSMLQADDEPGTQEPVPPDAAVLVNNGGLNHDFFPAHYYHDPLHPAVYGGRWSFNQTFRNVGDKEAERVEWEAWVDAQSGLELATGEQGPLDEAIRVPGRVVRLRGPGPVSLYGPQTRGTAEAVKPGEFLYIPVGARVPIDQHGKLISVFFRVKPTFRDASGNEVQAPVYETSNAFLFPKYGPSHPRYRDWPQVIPLPPALAGRR